MAKVDRFEDLDAWKLARVLTGKVCRLSRDGDFARDFGFRDQICRASVSDDMMQSVSRISKMLAKLISYIASIGESSNLPTFQLSNLKND